MSSVAPAMRTTTYCYPWDLQRLGVSRSLAEIADRGFAAIDLAATYHPIDSLSPRGGLNLFSNARGAVFFPARAMRYGRIEPAVDAAIAPVWPAAAAEAQRIGMAINSWTITLFQPWIVDAHPDCARVLPWGDRSGSGVCAAHPDVRAYLATLCMDLAEQFGVPLFRLEGVVSHAFDLDWLRPRTLVRVPPLARTLANLCFCGSCKARGSDAGIDVAGLQARIVGTIEAEIADQPDAEGRAAAVASDGELVAYTERYADASVELVRDVAEALGDRAAVSVTVASPWRALLGETRDDALLTRLIEACTQVDLNVLNIPGNPLIARLNATLAEPRPLSALFVEVRNPTVTPAAMMAESGPDKMRANLQRCADFGVRELSLYNFGLLPDVDVRNFVETVGRLTLA